MAVLVAVLVAVRVWSCLISITGIDPEGEIYINSSMYITNFGTCCLSGQLPFFYISTIYPRISARPITSVLTTRMLLQGRILPREFHAAHIQVLEYWKRQPRRATALVDIE